MKAKCVSCGHTASVWRFARTVSRSTGRDWKMGKPPEDASVAVACPKCGGSAIERITDTGTEPKG